MSALIIGENERRQIAELRALAAAEQPRDVHGVTAAAVENPAAFRDAMQTMSVILPIGFRVCYTQEIQPNAPPPGLCHHLSVSVDRPGGMPSPEAIEVILAEFGMAPLRTSAGVWVEDISPGERAVNVVQLVGPAKAATEQTGRVIESFDDDDAADDAADDDPPPSLGPCCICEAQTGARTIVMLPVRSLIPGHGWGCVVCSLPFDGASAVICDDCATALEAGTKALRFACRGYPATEGRVPIEDLTVPHEHNSTVEH